jgi:hypothetical protein
VRLDGGCVPSATLSSMGDFTDMWKMARRIRNCTALSIAAATLLGVGANGAPQPNDPAGSSADALAAAVYFEGVPLADASDLSDADVARLIELLRDPTEIRQHANILVALGMSGSPAAFDAIADYARRGPSGELDRLAFRARRSIAYAMGHLARVDRRALAWLIHTARDESAEPQRSFRELGPARFARLMREGAITGLALSGRPEAASVLAEIAAKPGAEPRVVERANEALLLHAKMSSEGPAAVLQDGFGREQ